MSPTPVSTENKRLISVNFLSMNDFLPILRKGVDIMLAGSETYCVPTSLVNFLLMTQTSGLMVQNEHHGVVKWLFGVKVKAI